MSDWYEEMEKAEQERDAFEYDLAMEYRLGRADAIDEFVSKIKLSYLGVHPDGYIIHTIQEK